MNRKRLQSLPTIADQLRAFSVIDTVLHQLSNGYVHETDAGLVFKDGDTWYGLIPALEGWVEFWKYVSNKKAFNVDLNVFETFIDTLRAGGELNETILLELKAVVIECKRYYKKSNVHEMVSMANTCMLARRMRSQGLTNNESE